jgi:hypothetical protein
VPGPPSHREVIKGLFDYRNDDGLAKSLTLLADSISHAGTLGLTAYLGMSDPPQLSGTPRKSILRMTASDANLMMTAALMALIRAGSERIDLQGQPADDWANTAERCMTTVQDVLAAHAPRIS